MTLLLFGATTLYVLLSCETPLMTCILIIYLSTVKTSRIIQRGNLFPANGLVREWDRGLVSDEQIRAVRAREHSAPMVRTATVTLSVDRLYNVMRWDDPILTSARLSQLRLFIYHTCEWDEFASCHQHSFSVQTQHSSKCTLSVGATVTLDYQFTIVFDDSRPILKQ